MKIAMISEHASPLAALSGADAGGQTVHVAELSAALARRGHDVDVYTRTLDTGVYDVTGLLIPPKDPRACANAINAIRRDRRAASSFGRAGRERARARYSWDGVATDTLRVYERLLPTAAPARASNM